jgi:signal transduction histidine kinase
LAYDQRQTITMLVAQAFRYKTLIDASMRQGSGDLDQLTSARQDIRDTMDELARQTTRELGLISEAERSGEIVEGERLGKIEAGFSAIDSLVERIRELRRVGSETEASLLHLVVQKRFEDDIARLLAVAVADEQGEVAEANARIAELAVKRIAVLIWMGLCALCLSVATGVALDRSLSRPIQRLLGGVRSLAAGNLKHRVVGSGADEFTELASQFNEMAVTLEDREQRLIIAQSGLEREVAQRTAELASANDRLKYLDRRRLQFLAEVSHELRTPVTVLRGEAEVTLRVDPKSSDVYRESLTRIAQQAEQMGRLIDDLMFLVRSEADTVTFEKRRIDLRVIAAEAVRDGSVLARGNGIRVSQELPDDPVWAKADSQRLRQALLIGIDNAIKYSDADSEVTLSLSARNRRAVITVLNRGAGVPPDELPYVFERFYRIRAKHGQGPDGSRLGLPIAKWIVEAHGGAISLSSTPGLSTELVFELPLSEEGDL